MFPISAGNVTSGEALAPARSQTSAARHQVSGPQLVQSLVFHVLCGVGTLAAHVQQLTGVKVSDSDLSQRPRRLAGVGVFETIVRGPAPAGHALRNTPRLFNLGWRLVAIDGSQTSREQNTRSCSAT